MAKGFVCSLGSGRDDLERDGSGREDFLVEADLWVATVVWVARHLEDWRQRSSADMEKEDMGHGRLGGGGGQARLLVRAAVGGGGCAGRDGFFGIQAAER
ncbi:hypothetical protein HJC23_011221 [Cyclotella cryptica]|uniref:Uncharacterized protein n=1 Tax=Cyclotella cryptica TaxID=29204 RepID=A0ABD3PWG5_9STRA|eukprot:CCRYP_011050-RA/>CCRYP_011050-RA protein AED:0.42 eAED:0.42 QI:0/-1/0/1/-1/1/1/0/99